MRFLSDLCKKEKEQNEMKCLTEVTNVFFVVLIKQENNYVFLVVKFYIVLILLQNDILFLKFYFIVK